MTKQTPVKKAVAKKPVVRLGAKKKAASKKRVTAKQAATRDVVVISAIGPSDATEVETAAVQGRTRSLKAFRDELGWD